MLFNSTEFILVFLPVTLTGFLLLRRFSRGVALGWLILASIAFYAWWRPINLLIIIPSVLVDFALARLMVLWADKPSRAIWRTGLLVVGLVLNVALLGYFKYTTFFQMAANDIIGTNFTLTHVVLPLGLSFITFQKIAFLVDVHGGQIERFSFREYCLFVLFFPQVIAGPIVHFREMMPQFRNLPRRLDVPLLTAGVALFVIGLFKKVVLADSMAEHVNPIFQSAGLDGAPSLIPAWLAALGFTTQIYFDFSGYSDMASGLALCVGVRLPLNFDSPLKATNIIDFWSRWHITLTRFLTAYVYNPLALSATRRRLKRGKPGLAPKRFSAGAFASVLAGPTLFTMFISGFWHGAGYMFILWGLLHGGYLVVNHLWRRLGPRVWMDEERYDLFMKPVGLILTFFSVVLAMVVFRAPNMDVALQIFRGMLGLNGLELPRSLVDMLGIAGQLPSFVGVTSISLQAIGALAALLGIAMLLPNSMQFTARYTPVLGVERPSSESRILYRLLDFQPSVVWALIMSLLALVAFARFGGPSEFLYWQF
ncbi:MAG: MBOAT family O-acyltransferase [Pseudomonadales bacterium]